VLEREIKELKASLADSEGGAR